MTTFNAGDIQATASLDRTQFTRELDAATRLGKDFDGSVYTAKLKLDIGEFYEDVQEVDDRLDELAGKDVEAKAGLDTSTVAEKAAEADADIDELGDKSVEAKADLDIRPLEEKLDEAKAKAKSAAAEINAEMDSAGSGFSPGRYTALGSAVAVGIAGAAPAVVGLAGALGVLGGAFVGVGGAAKAYTADQKASETASRSAAGTEVSNAKAINSAEQAVADARKNAARSAEDSARTVADAQRSLVDANTTYVESEQKVADAAKAATQALADQQDKVNGFALDQEGASIALARAIENNNKVNANAASTSLDKREAIYQVNEAQAKLSEVQKQGIQDQQTLNDMQKAGIAGSPQVVAAKQAEASAAEGVQKAQEALATAQENQRRSAQDSAEAIQKALDNVASVQASQGAAAQKAAAQNDTYAAALAKLSPAGARFAQTLISMKSGWDQFQSDTQEAVLPGFTKLLQGIQGAQPEIEQGFTSLGKTLGGVGEEAGKLFENPVFQGKLVDALEAANPVIKATGDGLVTTFSKLVDFSTKAGPITTGLSSLITKTLGGVDSFFDGVASHASGVGSLFDGIGTIVQKTAGFVGTLIGEIGDAYSQISAKVGPTIDQLTAVLEKAGSQGLGSFATGVNTLLDVIKVGLQIIQPFAGFIGSLAGSFGAAALAAKVLSTPVKLVTSAIGSLTSAGTGLAGFLYKIAPAAATAGTSFDKNTGKIKTLGTESETAATKLSKVTSSVVGAAKNLPLIGLAVAGVVTAYEQLRPSADSVADAINQGGQAAADAKGGINGYGSAVSKAGGIAEIFGAQVGDVDKALQDHYDSLTPVQRATEYVTRSQNDLTYAIKQYGPQSEQAKEATNNLGEATKDMKDDQWLAEQAVKSLTDKLHDQQDQMIGMGDAQISFERATLRIKQAQQDVNDAVAKYGPNSDEAKQANLDLQQSYLDALDSAGQLADAQSAGLEPSAQTAAHTKAINDELVTLALQAGTNLPPALQTLINGMSDSGLAADGVTVKVDKLGNKILSLPPGKTLSFPNNADSATGAINDLAGALDKATGSYRRFTQEYLTDIGAMNTVGAGQSSPSGYGFLGHAATGGSLVPGQVTEVGEHGPELIFPNKAAFVATADQSKAIKQGFSMAGQSAGDSASQSDAIAAGLQQLISLFQSGLSASFDSGSLEKGLIKAGKARSRR